MLAISLRPPHPADFLSNTRIGRNHFLVISSAFVLLSARAWIHRTDQLKIGWEGQRALRPADGHNLVFDWLAQHFQHAHPEFGELIQK